MKITITIIEISIIVFNLVCSYEYENEWNYRREEKNLRGRE
jgi:hypothetical protein